MTRLNYEFDANPRSLAALKIYLVQYLFGANHGMTLTGKDSVMVMFHACTLLVHKSSITGVSTQ